MMDSTQGQTQKNSFFSRDIIVLMICACFLFFAGAYSLSIPTYDDCFYAQKGKEMAEAGNFFTVTWGGYNTFQHPPFQFWVIGKFFLLFGENDLAARMPSILMALGLLLMVYYFGRRSFSHNVGLFAVAILLITPVFIENARRCMLDIPLSFWITTALFIYMRGLSNSRWYLLLSIPIALAVLSKSVLGLLPGLIICTGIVSKNLRHTLKSPYLWCGFVLGVLGGLSWPLHQYLVFGEEALQRHFVGEVISRSTQSLDLLKALTFYPLALLEKYEPLALFGFIGGGIFLFNYKKERSPYVDMLLLWFFVPLVFYSCNSALIHRYIFPAMFPLAIFAAYGINKKLPRVAMLFAKYIIPVLIIIVSLIYCIKPSILTRDRNQFFKKAESPLTSGISIPFYGKSRFVIASPMLYYWDVHVKEPAASAQDAVRQAKESADGLLVCDKNRIDEIKKIAETEIVLEGNKGWVVLRIKGDGSV